VITWRAVFITRRPRTPAYTHARRRRTRRVRAPIVLSGDTEIVLFDTPAELPTATVVPHAPRARARAIVADLRAWLAARWRWFRPRLVPALVAATSLVVFALAGQELARRGAARPREHRVVSHAAPAAHAAPVLELRTR
jgi:hypothetical protein